MKVALVAEWVDAWRGGAETSTLQFMHHLMDLNVEVHVFTRSRPSPTPGLHVHTISGASMSRTRRSVTFNHRVEHLLQAERFDVVHAISPCRFADVYQPRGGTVAETIERTIALRSTAAARTVKRYASRFNLKQRYMLRLERQIFRDPHGPLVIALSDYIVRQLKHHYRLPDERIRKVFNGVDPDSADAAERARDRAAIRGEFGIGGSDLFVLAVAHNFKLKGVHRWMEALARLQRGGRTDVRSVVVGKGDSDWWLRRSAGLGLDRHLVFAGPSNRVPAFLHAADVLVHPTYYDPCSRVVLEAMSAGLPCITTRWDGAAEIIENGVSGFVLDDPSDVEDLCARVELLCDAGRRSGIGGAARSATSRLAMRRHAEEVCAVYEALVGRASSQVSMVRRADPAPRPADVPQRRGVSSSAGG